MPTSPPNGHSAHVHIWWPGRLTVSCCTPNPAFIDPFDAPHIQTEGCHMGGDGYLQGLEDSQGRGLQCQSDSLSGRSGGFRFDSFRLLRGQLGYGDSGNMIISFRLGGAGDMEECDIAPLRSPYKPSASDPATASCMFCSPSASNCCASSFIKLAHLSKSSPWKRDKRGLSQRPDLVIKQ